MCYIAVTRLRIEGGAIPWTTGRPNNYRVGHGPVISGTYEVGESCDPSVYLGKLARSSDNRGVMCMGSDGNGEWVGGP
ncbi:hypothetical protein JK358_20545 [Nocardia sp. 2]|uniref:Uncharacterized protein n=1 Tax=Nocardia acididurans TaxID=2802282 RepID=A0ABS1M824_9NOCA|nr:hypothetical protein [Nocardia acididurans]MBL1076790.1 hypothetical protein [Nocardia acididurans]